MVQRYSGSQSVSHHRLNDDHADLDFLGPLPKQYPGLAEIGVCVLLEGRNEGVNARGG